MEADKTGSAGEKDRHQAPFVPGNAIHPSRNGELLVPYRVAPPPASSFCPR
jgi:hypothetical protein